MLHARVTDSDELALPFIYFQISVLLLNHRGTVGI
jgi:hypothetical protein